MCENSVEEILNNHPGYKKFLKSKVAENAKEEFLVKHLESVKLRTKEVEKFVLETLCDEENNTSKDVEELITKIKKHDVILSRKEMDLLITLLEKQSDLSIEQIKRMDEHSYARQVYLAYIKEYYLEGNM